jgi:hypothetical protein
MPTSMHERPCPLNGIGQDRGNLNLPASVFTPGFNKFRVQSERCRVNQVFLCKIHLQPSEYI